MITETLAHMTPLISTLTTVGWDLAVSAFLGTILSFALGAAFDADSWSRWALGALATGATLAGLSLWRTATALRRPAPVRVVARVVDRRPAPADLPLGRPEPVILWVMGDEDRPTTPAAELEPAPQRRLLATRETHLADGARFAAHFDELYRAALRGEADVEDLRDLVGPLLGYAKAAGLPPAEVARLHASLWGRVGNVVRAAKARAAKARARKGGK